MIREELTEEDCGLNSSWSISCSFPTSLFPLLISNWWNCILGNMPRRSFSILIAVWNFTFPAPLGNCSLRHAVFFSKFPCSYCLTHLCSPQIYAVKYYSVTVIVKQNSPTETNSTAFDFLIIFCPSCVYSLVSGVWHKYGQLDTHEQL